MKSVSNNVMARVFNKPLLLHPEYAQSLSNVLLTRIGAEQLPVHPSMNALFSAGLFDDVPVEEEEHQAFSRAPSPGRRDWYMLKSHDEIGILPVRGSLTADGPEGFASLGQSYKSILRDFEQMNSDPAVKANAIYAHSPGGEVTAITQTLQGMLAAKSKPTWAFVNEHAYSAMQWLVLVADHVVVTPMSGMGSIGVVYTHFDYSAALEQAGISATFVHSGDTKVDGNSLQPLSDRARRALQEESDGIWDQFINDVAANRPRMNPTSVRATQAATFQGKGAIDIGLADEMVQTERQFLDLLRAEIQSSNSTPTDDGSTAASPNEEEANLMSGNSQASAAAPEPAAAAPVEQAAPAAPAAPAAVDPSERFFAVMESDLVAENGPRRTLAMQWLKNPAMAGIDADGILAMVAEVPEQAAAAAPAEPKEEPLGPDALAMLDHAERSAGRPVSSNRGEGAEGSEGNDGTGEHRNVGTAQSAEYKSTSKLGAPPEGFGPTRSHMMDGMLGVAKKVAAAERQRRKQI